MGLSARRHGPHPRSRRGLPAARLCLRHPRRRETAMSMPAALQRRRDYAGPALFSYGFRPFFLAAGLWATFGILLWLPQYMGYCTLPTHLGPLEWHVHEMLFG